MQKYSKYFMSSLIVRPAKVQEKCYAARLAKTFGTLNLNHLLLQFFPYVPDVIWLSNAKIKDISFINIFWGYEPLIYTGSLTSGGDVMFIYRIITLQ